MIDAGGIPAVFICALSYDRWHRSGQFLTYVLENTLFKVRERNFRRHTITDRRVSSLPPRYMEDDCNIILVNRETRGVILPRSEKLRLGIDGRNIFAVGGVH